MPLVRLANTNLLQHRFRAMHAPRTIVGAAARLLVLAMLDTVAQIMALLVKHAIHLFTKIQLGIVHVQHVLAANILLKQVLQHAKLVMHMLAAVGEILQALALQDLAQVMVANLA